jgi:hypothetical protein
LTPSSSRASSSGGGRKSGTISTGPMRIFGNPLDETRISPAQESLITRLGDYMRSREA